MPRPLEPCHPRKAGGDFGPRRYFQPLKAFEVCSTDLPMFHFSCSLFDVGSSFCDYDGRRNGTSIYLAGGFMAADWFNMLSDERG